MEIVAFDSIFALETNYLGRYQNEIFTNSMTFTIYLLLLRIFSNFASKIMRSLWRLPLASINVEAYAMLEYTYHSLRQPQSSHRILPIYISMPTRKVNRMKAVSVRCIEIELPRSKSHNAGCRLASAGQCQTMKIGDGRGFAAISIAILFVWSSIFSLIHWHDEDASLRHDYLDEDDGWCFIFI